MREDIIKIMERFKALGLKSMELKDGSFSLSLIAREIEDSTVTKEEDYENKERNFFNNEIEEKTVDVNENKSLNCFEVKAPLVGIYYSKPSPDEKNYVNVGDIVNKGEVLCIIEAMKIYNEVVSPIDGRISKIYKKDGETINFDEILFLIESDD